MANKFKYNYFWNQLNKCNAYTTVLVDKNNYKSIALMSYETVIMIVSFDYNVNMVYVDCNYWFKNYSRTTIQHVSKFLHYESLFNLNGPYLPQYNELKKLDWCNREDIFFSDKCIVNFSDEKTLIKMIELFAKYK